MTSNFSGALQLTDLNDFITPSQECIKPLAVDKKPKKKGISKIEISTDGSYMEVDLLSGKEKKLKKAEITLTDCLACSGCITSAETVLVAMQSQAELYRVLNENKALEENKKKVVVVSVSPQSRSSLATKHSLSAKDASAALSMFFKSIGASFVVDTSFARELALLRSADEFMDRYRKRKENENQLPMLTSSCPGWICYAEKTHGELVLPHISSVKSPQQIMGSLIKDYVLKHCSVTPDQVYHVTVMPCYDKKLEASRSDFYSDLYSTRDVDLVLTSGEVEDMLSNDTTSLTNILKSLDTLKGHKNLELPELNDALLENSTLIHHEGGGSGGYLDFVFKKSAKELFGRDVDKINFKPLRNNKDFCETSLVDEEGKTILNFAYAYGFRSIQNLVQKMKRKKCSYDFVEVMACPSGCLNGGGQIKSEAGDREDQKKILSDVEANYNEIESSLPGNNQSVNFILDSLKDKTDQYLHTQYHAVEKDESLSLNVKW